MKIPDSVRISGVEYAIVTEPNLRDSGQLLCGRIDYNSRTIYLSETDCRSYEFRCIVLWHEIIHGILEDRRLQLDEDVEESVCEALSRGIYQVLQDNARKFFAGDFIATAAQGFKALEEGGRCNDTFTRHSNHSDR
jgi:hypothetical protein